MNLVAWILLGLVQYAVSQNTGTSNDFSNFNSFFSNGGNGVSDPNAGLTSGTAMPTLLGSGQTVDLTQAGATGMSPGLTATNPAGMPGQGMNTMSVMPGQTMNTMSGMPGQTGMPANQQMMNPTGMGMPGQTGNMGMNGGMPGQQQFMQNGMPGGLQQTGMAGGGMQQGGMSQMNFQDPTRMGSLSNGNSFNNMAFDPRTQQNLFNDQLNQQNTPTFGGQSQGMQGQFGQSPFMQQSFGGQRPMPGQMPMMGGGRFATPFTSQPSGFGPFQDPMMNAFAPANPFMQRPPMMMPMGPFMVPGMRKFSIFL